jgi:transcriptional regulator with XRE-family HTH domain
MNVKVKIGQRIKELRTLAGYSQMKLSDRSNLDRTYITSVENGKRNISIENINNIATALNVTLKEFFNDQRFN